MTITHGETDEMGGLHYSARPMCFGSRGPSEEVSRRSPHDTSPKVIDLEGLGKRHRGTRQHNSHDDRQRNIMAFAKRCCPCLKPCQSKRRFIDEN